MHLKLNITLELEKHANNIHCSEVGRERGTEGGRGEREGEGGRGEREGEGGREGGRLGGREGGR